MRRLGEGGGDIADDGGDDLPHVIDLDNAPRCPRQDRVVSILARAIIVQLALELELSVEVKRGRDFATVAEATG